MEAPHAANWHENQWEAVTETDNVTILRIAAYKQTGKSKQTSQSELLKLREKKNCKLIDKKIPADKNVSVAEFEKLSNYKNLEIE